MAKPLSNSQVEAYQKCRRMYFYAHDLRLAPKVYPDHLLRGIVGHEALAEYYKFIRAEGWARREDGKKMAMDFLFKEGAKYITQLHVIAQLTTLLQEYFSYYDSDRFKILKVEEMYIEQRNTSPDFGMRLDILLEMEKGPYKGQLIMMDHKFTYNFFSQTLIDLNVQLPKYIGVLRRLGFPVSRGMFNQIRTREWKSDSKTDLFKRSFTEKYTDTEIEDIESDHNLIASEIESKSQLPVSMRSSLATRNPGNQTCNYCDFVDICALDRRGVDTSKDQAAHYRVNPYGYGK